MPPASSYPRSWGFVVSELFSVARHARFPKLGSKPGWFKRQSKILPLSDEETSASKGNLNAYVSHLFLFTYIRLTAIYIYIFTNLISTSIHGTRKKQKKPWPGTRDKNISNHRPEEEFFFFFHFILFIYLFSIYLFFFTLFYLFIYFFFIFF